MNKIPVLKESIFSRDSALCENDIESMSVRSTDLRLAEEKVYRTEGKAPRGNRINEGVLHDRDTSSVIQHQVSKVVAICQHALYRQSKVCLDGRSCKVKVCFTFGGFFDDQRRLVKFLPSSISKHESGQ